MRQNDEPWRRCRRSRRSSWATASGQTLRIFAVCEPRTFDVILEQLRERLNSRSAVRRCGDENSEQRERKLAPKRRPHFCVASKNGEYGRASDMDKIKREIGVFLCQSFYLLRCLLVVARLFCVRMQLKSKLSALWRRSVQCST